MKNLIFRGIATAMVTPMTATGVDYDALARFIDFQLEEGINALVAVGTTGESATLTPQERKEVIRFTVERVAGRVPVIAGTGTNNTQHVLEFTKSACDDGADAVLVVTPYYNKATQNGLVQMYTAIADASTKPIIVYNVPSRTGVNIQPATYQKLAQHPRIAGIKEANGDISSIVTTASLVGDSLSIYSGNDDQTVPMMALGAKGVISVLSNVAPRQVHDMCAAFKAGDVAKARQMQIDAIPLIEALFCEVNPIPVKEAMNMMGEEVGPFRKPLVDMEPANRDRLRRELVNYGISLKE